MPTHGAHPVCLSEGTQRTQKLISFRHIDATDRPGNTQLPTTQRDHAYDIQAIYGKDGGGMETDIQSMLDKVLL